MEERRPIIEIIDDIEREPSSTVVALPLMCGSGKSTAISTKIIESIKKREGLLIITDRKKRFKQYLDPYDTEAKEFIKQNEKQIACLTSETAYLVDKFELYRPVLMMTTQKYFRLTREQIGKYLSWGYNQSKRRKLIIFDEQPELFFQTRIDLQILNQFEEAYIRLTNGAGKGIAASSDLIHLWLHRKASFLGQVSLAENCAENEKNYYTMLSANPHSLDEDSPNGLSEDVDPDAQVFQSVFAAKKRIAKLKFNPNDIIRGLSLLYQRGALYSYRNIRTGKYESYILPTQSTKDKLTGLGAKVIILDGTADLSMDYHNQTYIDVRKDICAPYVRKMPNLHVILVRDKTSKSTLESQSVKRLHRFEEYVKEDSKCETVYIFSYKTIVETLKEMEQAEANGSDEASFALKDYFGNLVGRNDFQDVTVFGQVGLFTKPESFYLAKALELYPAYRDSLNLYIDAPEKYDEVFSKLKKIIGSNKYQALKNNDILADIEQNIFRSPIRTEHFDGEVRYYIFFDYKRHQSLKQLIYRRFHDHYGADVVFMNPFWEHGINKIRNRKTKDDQPSIPQRIIEYIDKLENGTVFTRKQLLDTTGLESTQFNSALQRNRDLAEGFASWRIKGRKGYYKKDIGTVPTEEVDNAEAQEDEAAQSADLHQ